MYCEYSNQTEQHYELLNVFNSRFRLFRIHLSYIRNGKTDQVIALTGGGVIPSTLGLGGWGWMMKKNIILSLCHRRLPWGAIQPSVIALMPARTCHKIPFKCRQSEMYMYHIDDLENEMRLFWQECPKTSFPKCIYDILTLKKDTCMSKAVINKHK